MKSKLGRKLLTYFLAVLFIFIIILSILFYQMGQVGLQENYQHFLEKRVEEISASITSNKDYLDQNPFFKEELTQPTSPRESGRNMGGGPLMMNSMSGGHHGFMHPSDIQLFNDILSSNIWIINPIENEILVGSNQESVAFNNLTEDQQQFINRSIAGETVSSDLFELAQSENLITAAAPIYDGSQNIIGALLLHESYSPFGNFFQSVSAWFIIATLIAVGLTIILAIYFAKLFIQPIYQLDQQVQYLVAGDYSERVKVKQKDELGELSLQINRLAGTLEEVRHKEEHFRQLRQDFMSNISHELKTPVTVMKSSLEALNLGILSREEEKEYHQALYDESVVLERLIQDLLDLSVLQNTQFSIAQDDLNLMDVLNDAVRSQSMLASEQKVTIKKDFKQLDLPFRGDYTRLRQMFVTVLNNALKYSDPQSEVLIKQTSDGSQSSITIYNKGQPINAEQIDLLFHSFVRLGEDRHQGFGLGLAIAKEIADRHDIQIEVNSNEEGRTSFKFIFSDY